MNEKVSVSATALSQVLIALTGSGHLIREMQVTMDPELFEDNPITILINDYNKAVRAK